MFRVGQKVARIGGSEQNAIEYGRPFPAVGEPCTVSNIYMDDDGDLQIELIEYPSPATAEFYAGFLAELFRPIVSRPTSIEFAHEILRKATRTDEVTV
jgi:hypothetical protein